MERINLKGQLDKQLFYGFRKAFIRNSSIPVEARLLLILLITYLGKNKNCWASQGKLAKDMGCDVDTVRKYLRILQEAGHLIMQNRGIGRSLLYTPSYLIISAGKTEKIEKNTKPAEILSQTPTETPEHRSITSGNKEETITGKELFDKKRKELGLISKRSDLI